MLVLTVQIGEVIRIGDVEVSVVDGRGARKVRIGIEAARQIPIVRVPETTPQLPRGKAPYDHRHGNGDENHR